MLITRTLERAKQQARAISNDQRGLTLLDISIMLMVIGLIAAPLISQYHTWDKQQKFDTTRARISAIEDAIERYYITNGYYPCPALASAAPGEAIAPAQRAQFGEEDRAWTVTPGDPNDVEPCYPLAGPGDPDYISGMVPFKSLGLSNDDILDAWGNRLTYTVTRTLASGDPADYQANVTNGAITVMKPDNLQFNAATGEESCQPDVPADGIDGVTTGLHLLIMSHGADGKGAYMDNGTQLACTAGDNDSANCDGDNIFIHHECQRSESVAENEFYDDILYDGYGNPDDGGKWITSPRRMWENVGEDGNMASSAGYYGIGTERPEFPVDVAGNIRAVNTDPENTDKNGNLIAIEFCTSDGTACFRPDSITGEDPNFNCSGTGALARGIANNQTLCDNAFPVLAGSECPDGQFVIGINDEGEVICG